MAWYSKWWQLLVAAVVGAIGVLFITKRNRAQEIRDEVQKIKDTLADLDSGKIKPEVERQFREDLKRRAEKIREEIADSSPDEHMADLERDLARLLGDTPA